MVDYFTRTIHERKNNQNGKNINKFQMEELRLLILNTACYSALIITSVIILLTVLSSLLSKKIILVDYSKNSSLVNEPV